MKELSKTRLEVENAKRQIIQQEIAFNIQQTDALTRYVRHAACAKGYYLIDVCLMYCRSLSPSTGEPSFVRSSSHSSFDAHSLPRRAQKGRITSLEEDPTKVYQLSLPICTLVEWSYKL